MEGKPVMVTLKTACMLYDWKYDTIYKKYKKGQFVRAYQDPAGRGLRFALSDIDAWAKQCPIDQRPVRPSLVANEL